MSTPQIQLHHSSNNTADKKDMDYYHELRVKEVKEFDDLKIGVKGLVDSGVTTIPKFFIHPSQNLYELKTCSSDSTQIPIVDLLGVKSHSRHKEIIDQVSYAAREWGFFQVVNHGIPLVVLDTTISAIRAFHEQPQEIKKAYYDRNQPVTYVANNDLLRSEAASWRDTLLVDLSASSQTDQIPDVCREAVLQWSDYVTGLADTLMELLSEGLGLDAKRLNETKCSSRWILAGQYYPYCPQPELTIGIPSHTDKGVLTVVLQDQIGGLQIRKENEWVAVKPIPGALVINIGDFLQVISNDEYKSIEHRVLANPFQESRTSIAVFISPSEEKTDIYGPLDELLTPTKPAVFRKFSISEMNKIFASKELGKISLPNEFKL